MYVCMYISSINLLKSNLVQKSVLICTPKLVCLNRFCLPAIVSEFSQFVYTYGIVVEQRPRVMHAASTQHHFFESHSEVLQARRAQQHGPITAVHHPVVRERVHNEGHVVGLGLKWPPFHAAAPAAEEAGELRHHVR